MIKVNEKTVEYHEVEWGVEYFEPLIGGKATVPMDLGEPQAREEARILGGTVKVREVFVTEWADAP